MATMTDDHRDIIRHSLGLDYPDLCKRNGGPFRNFFCTHDGNEKLEALVKAGWMKHGPTLNQRRDRYYYVTEAGAAAVGSKLPDND